MANSETTAHEPECLCFDCWERACRRNHVCDDPPCNHAFND